MLKAKKHLDFTSEFTTFVVGRNRIPRRTHISWLIYTKKAVLLSRATLRKIKIMKKKFQKKKNIQLIDMPATLLFAYVGANLFTSCDERGSVIYLCI